MIRAIRPQAMAQDDASLISGWNLSPNVAYVVQLNPGSSACGVLVYKEGQTAIVASGAGLVGTDQPVILHPYYGQTVGMVDADLGWHLLLTTDGTEYPRTVRIGPAVDLPDEIHPIYSHDGLAVARATAGVDDHAHYIDDVTVACPLGLGADLGDVASVPVDGAAVVGQVESITWTGTPDGASEQAVIRRHVAIAPGAHIDPDPVVPPSVTDDTGATDAATATSGNVLTNDEAGLTVVAVNGLSARVGQSVAGSNGGVFTIASTGVWTFDPDGDFATLSGSETADTSVTYYASDGTGEAMGTLTVTVSAVTPTDWTPAEITTSLWLDASDSMSITVAGSGVSQWIDKSGNGRHGLQSVDSLRPGQTSINSKGAIAFAAGKRFSLASALPLTANQIAIAVYTRPSAASHTVWLANDAVGGFPYYWFTDNYRYVEQGLASNGRSSSASSATGTFLHCVVRDNTTLSLFGAGSAVSLTSASSPGGAQCTQIGARRIANSEFMIGAIGEIVVVDVSDSATRQKLEGYFAHKWGLTASLPSDHPYKSAPPTL